MDDLIFIQRALNRTKDYNIDTSNSDDIIVFLEKKLEYAEGQIHNCGGAKENKRKGKPNRDNP